MLYIKAEMGIDNDSIIAQIERVKKAEVDLRIELDELDCLFNKINIVEKGTPESHIVQYRTSKSPKNYSSISLRSS